MVCCVVQLKDDCCELLQKCDELWWWDLLENVVYLLNWIVCCLSEMHWRVISAGKLSRWESQLMAGVSLAGAVLFAHGFVVVDLRAWVVEDV